MAIIACSRCHGAAGIRRQLPVRVGRCQSGAGDCPQIRSGRSCVPIRCSMAWSTDATRISRNALASVDACDRNRTAFRWESDFCRDVPKLQVRPGATVSICRNGERSFDKCSIRKTALNSRGHSATRVERLQSVFWDVRRRNANVVYVAETPVQPCPRRLSAPSSSVRVSNQELLEQSASGGRHNPGVNRPISAMAELETEQRFQTLFEQAPFSVQLLSVDGER